VADRPGLPGAVHTAAATPPEVTLVPNILAATFTSEHPHRLIGDKAYDSDPLELALAAVGVELIAPHRANHQRPTTQDGRPLRRYKRRWKVERLFAWLQNFRRVLVRHEYHAENFLGLVHLGCIMILLRWYL
jgi:transposase